MSSSGIHSSSAPLKLLIAEDQELARMGLSQLLKLNTRFQVVAEACNGEEAIALVTHHQPDIILMDIEMPKMNGITATQQIKSQFPHIKIIMLTSIQNGEEVYAALSAGADGYCLKDIQTERLIQVLGMVAEGVIWLDPVIARMVMKTLPDSAEGRPSMARKSYNVDLTEREWEILNAIVDGKSNKEIAESLNIALNTVKTHVCNVIQKLAVDDRTQAAVKALESGMITRDKNTSPEVLR